MPVLCVGPSYFCRFAICLDCAVLVPRSKALNSSSGTISMQYYHTEWILKVLNTNTIKTFVFLFKTDACFVLASTQAENFNVLQWSVRFSLLFSFYNFTILFIIVDCI